jgi:hypothetical protein
VDGDPLADISLLAEPDHITAVWGRRTPGQSEFVTRRPGPAAARKARTSAGLLAGPYCVGSRAGAEGQLT